MRQLLLVKYGEIALKGKNRPHFERVLISNLDWALRTEDAGSDHRLRRLPGRMVVTFSGSLDDRMAVRFAEAAARVFGVVGVARAREVPLDSEEIVRACVEVAREEVRAGAKTFKLVVKRSNKAYPRTSPEIAAEVGRRVLEEVPGLAVDVHEPELRLGVEIREDAAYVYGRELPGPGGLPVGTSGRVIALLSGGIDSPVAIWMAMKRGLEVVPLHFWSYPFTGERALEKVRDLCRLLGRWGPLGELMVTPFTEVQTTIRDVCPEELRVTVMRRMMMRVAESLADKVGAAAIVTGESLGQVASQTLENLATIEAVTTLPVLRPLIGLDKEEIVNRARRIGTFEVSVLPYEDCCTLFVPAHPRTRPTRGEAERAEAGLDICGLVGRAVAGTTRSGGVRL